jgi:hypothetical protein
MVEVICGSRGFGYATKFCRGGRQALSTRSFVKESATVIVRLPEDWEPDWTVNQLTDEAVSPGGALTKLSGNSKPPSSRRKDCLARSMEAVRMGSMFWKPRSRRV